MKRAHGTTVVPVEMINQMIGGFGPNVHGKELDEILESSSVRNFGYLHTSSLMFYNMGLSIFRQRLYGFPVNLKMNSDLPEDPDAFKDLESYTRFLFGFDQLMNIEHQKTMFLLNYAYMSQQKRRDF